MHSAGSVRRIWASVMCGVCLLAGSAFAQDCETYDLHGAITNKQGKPIKGALVDLLDAKSKELIKIDRWDKPMPKVKSGLDGSYGISVIDLPSYSQRNGTTYVLRVSAPGFTSHEQKIDIGQCGFKLDIKLVKTKRPVGNVGKTR
jgi:hypothetical protein